MLGKRHGGLYKALTKEERRKRDTKRRERSDQIYQLSRIRFTCFVLEIHILLLVPHTIGTVISRERHTLLQPDKD